jgi:hypothetical protein
MPTRSTHDEPPGPTAPAIPSFASLRSTRGRSAVDLLVPGLPAPVPPAPAPVPAVLLASGTASRDRPAPRPAEYGDLLRLGLRAARLVAGLPGCVLQRLRAGLGG